MRKIVLTLVSVLTLAVLSPLGPAHAATTVTRPNQDPFYTYSGSVAAIAPGTILRTRSVTLPTITTPSTSTQVLYVTTDQLGQHRTAVATIIEPTVAKPGTLVTYQTYYDGLGDICDPSYTLQQSPSSPTDVNEGTFINNYVQNGFPVVTADYEELNRAFGAGRQEAYGTLDAIRAAMTVLKMKPSTTNIASIGYSGGAIASVYAAELAPTYAPELHFVGTAAGGVATNYADILRYINGSPTWAGAMPAVMLGVARGYGLDIYDYTSAYGAGVINEVSGGCINPSHPITTYQQMLKPQYNDIFKVQTFTKILNDHIMSRAGRPQQPFYLGVGEYDGTGDGVMIANDVAAQARAYCAEGLAVTYQKFQDSDHYKAAVQFEPLALSWVTQRLTGIPAPDGCALVPAGVGNLRPLPILKNQYAGRAPNGHGIQVRSWTTIDRYQDLTYTLVGHGRVIGQVTGVNVTTAPSVEVIPTSGSVPVGSTVQVLVHSGQTLMTTLSYVVR